MFTSHTQSPDFAFAFHDSDEIGPKMLARIAKHIGFTPEDMSGCAAHPYGQPDAPVHALSFGERRPVTSKVTPRSCRIRAAEVAFANATPNLRLARDPRRRPRLFRHACASPNASRLSRGGDSIDDFFDGFPSVTRDKLYPSSNSRRTA